MKNKYLIIIVVILSIIAIVSSPSKNKTAFLDELESNQMNVVIKDSKTNEEKNMLLEDYVIGVVAGEMPASFNEEALKAQAIAARTYAVYKVKTSNTTYDLVTDVSNQVYLTKEQMQEKWGNSFEKYYNKIKNIVTSTADMVMKYNGNVISSYYFAMSNGKTEDVSMVFGGNVDYLKSVDSSWDKDVKNFEVTKTMTKQDFCENLNIDCGNIVIGAINRSDSGRVNTIVINNKTFKGTSIRSMLGIRSTDFTIEVKDNVSITTRGFGHGVGMSQYGAEKMAENGYKYDEILKHYYQNVDIEKISV